MRIFVAGATGAVGRFLLPKLIRAGYEVIGRRTGFTDSLNQL